MPPGRGQLDGLLPGLGRARGLDHRVVAARLALTATEQVGRGAAGLAGEREQAAERAAAEHRDAQARPAPGVIGGVHRARQRLDRRGDLGRRRPPARGARFTRAMRAGTQQQLARRRR